MVRKKTIPTYYYSLNNMYILQIDVDNFLKFTFPLHVVYNIIRTTGYQV